jgi:Ca2+/H+ antiporter, TMEM165/GDT1 family
MNSRRRCRPFWFLIPLAFLAFIFLCPYVVQLLWNGVLTQIVSVNPITYWQAFGLLLLAKILFGGLPGSRGCCGGGGPGARFRDHLKSKRWAAMDPAERERLKNEMRQRFGDWPRPPRWDCCSSDEPNDDAPRPPAKP